MLPRHRRRQYLAGTPNGRSSALFVRVAVAAVILIAVWFTATTAIRIFDRSIGRKTAAVLATATSDSVQVSLQEEDWQRGENGLKLYAGDAVATRGNGDATLTFFDGTKVRLDAGTDLLVEQSDNEQNATSLVSMKQRSGRIWIVTPDMATYSGAVTRTVTTADYTAELPANTNALISSTIVNVMKAAGLGAQVTVNLGTKPSLYVGEGQYFSLSEQNKRAIEEGSDPYDFRDPVTVELLKDEFLISSYAAMNKPAPAGPTTPGTETPTQTQPLVVTSPENRVEIKTKTVTVSGKVGDRISQVLVNGQTITLKSDLSFSAEVSIPQGETKVLTIEAQDVQGVPVAKVERTVISTYKAIVEPVRIKSPVGSGETLNTNQNEVEITGEAPAGTAVVMVNDYKLQLFKPGSKTWSYLASTQLANLREGQNIFVVYALDADGNKSPPRSITIVLNGAAPTGTGSTASQPPLKQNPPLQAGTLSVQQPTAGMTAETNDNELSIVGKTSGDTGSISVNGYNLSLYQAGSTSGKYIASTELGTMKRGKNVYRIVARNKDGEILDVLEYTITFNP
jgi:hypothetical protein